MNEELMRRALEEVEWITFGNWDTLRCPWCKGMKRKGGHTPNCIRQRALGVDLPLFSRSL
jgi:hypothetical protein